MTLGPRACPGCHALDARDFLITDARSPDGEQYRVVVCAACGLRYTRPLPTDQEFNRLYDEDYSGYGGVEKAAKAKGLLQFAANWLTKLFRQLLVSQRRRALLGRPAGRLLDVGCGNGDFLASLKRDGWEVYGTDLADVACKRARNKGITVHQGTLANAGYPDNFFDVVTLWHVLEHLPNPTDELIQILRVLRDDGLLIVEVPNGDCLTLKLCGTHWLHLDVPRHLQHFTTMTLRKLLEKSGFVVVRRQDFHMLEFVSDFYSFMNRLGFAKYFGIRQFSTDFSPAGLALKMMFLLVGLPLAALSMPYSFLMTLLGRNGETVTITARKTGR